MRNTVNPTMQLEADAELDAFNAAFDELGLEWRWDRATITEFGGITDDKDRVRTYVNRHHPHLLKVYDAEFLSELVVDTKRRQARTGPDAAVAAPQQNAYA